MKLCFGLWVTAFIATQAFSGAVPPSGSVCLDLDEVTLYEGRLGTYAKDGTTRIEVGDVKITSAIHRCSNEEQGEQLVVSMVLDEQIDEYDVNFTSSILEVQSHTSLDVSVNRFFALGRTEFSFGDLTTIKPDPNDRSDHIMQISRERAKHIWRSRNLEEVFYAGLTPEAVAEGKRPIACSISSLFLSLQLDVPQKENMTIDPMFGSIRDFKVPAFCN